MKRRKCRPDKARDPQAGAPRGPRRRTLEYVEEADRVQHGRCSTPGDFVAAVENLCIVRARALFQYRPDVFHDFCNVKVLVEYVEVDP